MKGLVDVLKKFDQKIFFTNIFFTSRSSSWRSSELFWPLPVALLVLNLSISSWVASSNILNTHRSNALTIINYTVPVHTGLNNLCNGDFSVSNVLRQAHHKNTSYLKSTRGLISSQNSPSFFPACCGRQYRRADPTFLTIISFCNINAMVGLEWLKSHLSI